MPIQELAVSTKTQDELALPPARPDEPQVPTYVAEPSRTPQVIPKTTDTQGDYITKSYDPSFAQLAVQRSMMASSTDMVHDIPHVKDEFAAKPVERTTMITAAPTVQKTVMPALVPIVRPPVTQAADIRTQVPTGGPLTFTKPMTVPGVPVPAAPIPTPGVVTPQDYQEYAVDDVAPAMPFDPMQYLPPGYQVPGMPTAAPEEEPKEGLPSWVLPVTLGAIGLGVIYYVMKKR